MIIHSTAYFQIINIIGYMSIYRIVLSYSFISISLSGWWFQPLWKILVSWGYYSQYMEKSILCSKPPTSHSYSITRGLIIIKSPLISPTIGENKKCSKPPTRLSMFPTAYDIFLGDTLPRRLTRPWPHPCRKGCKIHLATFASWKTFFETGDQTTGCEQVRHGEVPGKQCGEIFITHRIHVCYIW